MVSISILRILFFMIYKGFTIITFCSIVLVFFFEIVSKKIGGDSSM